MGFLDNFRYKPKDSSIEELEDDLDRVQMQSQIAGGQAEIAEREAIIRELKTKYGKDWKSVLGLKGMPSLPSLKSILHGLGNPKLAKAANSEIGGKATSGIRKQMLQGGEKLRGLNDGEKLRRSPNGDKLRQAPNADKLRRLD